MHSPAELVTLFRSKGLKVTPQRELVFRLLHGETSHPSADAVHRRAIAVMPTISLKTVYQVLNDLRSLGEIDSLDLGTGATRFDPNTDEHHHLVCEGCGEVVDVALAAPPQLRLRDHEFVIRDIQVTFRGLCAACGVEAPRPASASGTSH